MKDRLILSFCLCEVITFCYIAVFDHLSGFILIMALHLVCFMVLALAALLLKAVGAGINTRHALAFVASVVTLFLILWKINGRDLVTVASNTASQKGFMPIVMPFLIANIASALIQRRLIKGRGNQAG